MYNWQWYEEHFYINKIYFSLDDTDVFSYSYHKYIKTCRYKIIVGNLFSCYINDNNFIYNTVLTSFLNLFFLDFHYNNCGKNVFCIKSFLTIKALKPFKAKLN